jgi:hypothetical protein
MAIWPKSAIVVAAGVAVLVGATVSPAAAAPPRPSTRDTATATGFHFQTFRAADVIAGSADTNVLISYTAGRPLTDGTIRIVLPGTDWTTPLRPADGYLYDEASDNGKFSVRPAPPDITDPTLGPATACSWPADTPLQSGVERVLGSQIIVIQHASCAAGQKLVVRIKGIAAPTRVGRHYLPVIASDADGPVRLSVATLDVVPVPRITLHLDPIGPEVQAGVPFIIKVTALGPDGRVAVGYRGAVAVVSENQYDCTLTPRDQSVAYQFTAADAGTAYITVELGQDVAHQLRVYDIANQARPAVSNEFQVVGSPSPVICPVAYH